MSYIAQKASLFNTTVEPVAEVKEAIDLFEYNIWLPNSCSENLILFHYTSAEGLIGILSSCSLWCTDVKYLNDPLELKYGKKIIYDKIQEYHDAEENSTIKLILKNLSQTIGILHRYDTYIVCFSQEDNLLSQWRNYASKGKGFNLGIEFNTECNLKTKTSCALEGFSKENYPILRKIIYKENEQNEILEKYISEIIRGTKEALKRIKELDWSTIVLYASNLLIELMLSFKNYNFNEEKEWRMITVLEKDHKPELRNFRIKNDEAVPYLDNFLYENINFIPTFPLRSIKYGPGLDDDITTSTLDVLLKNKSSLSKNIIMDLSKIKISGTGYSLK